MITLDFLNLNGEDASNELLATALKCDTRSAKVNALAALGIECGEDEKPLTAWVKAMCRKNNMPEVLPATEIGSAALELCPRWVFWLA